MEGERETAIAEERRNTEAVRRELASTQQVYIGYYTCIVTHYRSIPTGLSLYILILCLHD